MLKKPKYKICRRVGAQVFSKCENPKFSLIPKRKKTGRRKQISEYGLQLLEKQKVRYLYGLKERQFASYVKYATTKRGINPVEELYRTLESRLDNVIYRLGFAKTRLLARQIVSHGHITINGGKVTTPSYQVKVGEVIGIKDGSKKKTLFLGLGEKLNEQKTPTWLSLQEKEKEGKVESKPTLDDYSEALFNLTSVVEFYSR